MMDGEKQHVVCSITFLGQKMSMKTQLEGLCVWWTQQSRAIVACSTCAAAQWPRRDARRSHHVARSGLARRGARAHTRMPFHANRARCIRRAAPRPPRAQTQSVRPIGANQRSVRDAMRPMPDHARRIVARAPKTRRRPPRPPARARRHSRRRIPNCKIAFAARSRAPPPTRPIRAQSTPRSGC
jgi:hypothetical protein